MHIVLTHVYTQYHMQPTLSHAHQQCKIYTHCHIHWHAHPYYQMHTHTHTHTHIQHTHTVSSTVKYSPIVTCTPTSLQAHHTITCTYTPTSLVIHTAPDYIQSCICIVIALFVCTRGTQTLKWGHKPCDDVMDEQLNQMSGESLLLQSQSDPAPCSSHISLQLVHIVDHSTSTDIYTHTHIYMYIHSQWITWCSVQGSITIVAWQTLKKRLFKPTGRRPVLNMTARTAGSVCRCIEATCIRYTYWTCIIYSSKTNHPISVLMHFFTETQEQAPLSLYWCTSLRDTGAGSLISVLMHFFKRHRSRLPYLCIDALLHKDAGADYLISVLMHFFKRHRSRLTETQEQAPLSLYWCTSSFFCIWSCNSYVYSFHFVCVCGIVCCCWRCFPVGQVLVRKRAAHIRA